MTNACMTCDITHHVKERTYIWTGANFKCKKCRRIVNMPKMEEAIRGLNKLFAEYHYHFIHELTFKEAHW